MSFAQRLCERLMSNLDDIDPSAPYKVKLSAECVSTFEVLNSLCVVESYDRLLYYLETKLERVAKDAWSVPPADILIVLMTLVVVPEFGTGRYTAKSDPYNVGRASYGTRSLKILRYYMDLLLVGSAEQQSTYSLKLLQSQFFIVLDHLAPASSNDARVVRRSIPKRRKTQAGVLVDSMAEEDLNRSWQPSFRNPYTSYVSCLEHKPEIFNCAPLTSRLSQEGEFWNSVAWAMYASLSEDSHTYERGKVWMSLLTLIFDAFTLRNLYYDNNETRVDDGSAQKVENSPLARLFNALSPWNLKTVFCDVLFLGCDYGLASKLHVHPVYPKELKVVNTYVSRTSASSSYRLLESVKFRHRLMNLFFSFAKPDPWPKELETSKMSTSQNYFWYMGEVLDSFENLSQLKCFLSTTHLESFAQYLPYVAQSALSQKFAYFDSPYKLDLSTVRDDESGTQMTKMLTDAFEAGFPPIREDYDQSQRELYMAIEKCDIYLLVLLRYWVYINNPYMCSSVSFDVIKTLAGSNDLRRLAFARKRKWPDPPLLQMHLSSLLSMKL